MKGTNCPLGRFFKGQFQLQCRIGTMAQPGSNPDFWFGENVVYAIFYKANAWRGVTADDFPVVLIFQKRMYKEQLLCYHLLLNLKPCYIHHCICASSHVHSEMWGKNNFFIIFLKNAYSAFFSILKRSYLWKMRGYPQFSFWISIAPDMIYLSHIVIIWEKILPSSGHRP